MTWDGSFHQGVTHSHYPHLLTKRSSDDIDIKYTCELRIPFLESG